MILAESGGYCTVTVTVVRHGSSDDVTQLLASFYAGYEAALPVCQFSTRGYVSMIHVIAFLHATNLTTCSLVLPAPVKFIVYLPLTSSYISHWSERQCGVLLF